MAASDEDDSEFERFLQQSLSSSSASNRSSRNNPAFQKLLSAVREEEEEEEEEDEGLAGLQWLKVPHKDGTGDIRRGIEVGGEGGRGRGGEKDKEKESIKLELAVPTSLPMGGGNEGSETVTYSSDFSKDSIEVASTSTPSQRSHSAFQDSFCSATAGSSKNSNNLAQLHHSSSLNQSGLSSITEHTVKENESSGTETESDKDETTPTRLKLSPSSKHLANVPTNQQIHSSSHSPQKMVNFPNEEIPVISTSNKLHPFPNTTTSVSIPELKEKEERVSSEFGKTWNESDLRLAVSTDHKPTTASSDSLSLPSSAVLQLLQSQSIHRSTETKPSITAEEQGEGEGGECSEGAGKFTSLPLIPTAADQNQPEEVSPVAKKEEKSEDKIRVSLPRAASGELVLATQSLVLAQNEENVKIGDNVETKSLKTGHGESANQDLSPAVELQNDDITGVLQSPQATLPLPQPTSAAIGSVLPAQVEGSVIARMPVLIEAGEPGNEVSTFGSDVSSVKVGGGGKVREGAEEEGGEEEKQVLEEGRLKEEVVVGEKEMEQMEGEEEEEGKDERRSEEEAQPGREGREDSEWREVVLEEVGEGLERELEELQQALEAAGLPGIAGSGTSGGGGVGGISAAAATRDWPVFQQDSCASDDKVKMNRELQTIEKSEATGSVGRKTDENPDVFANHEGNVFSEVETSRNKHPHSSERATDYTHTEKPSLLVHKEAEVHTQSMQASVEVGEKTQQERLAHKTGDFATRIDGGGRDKCAFQQWMGGSEQTQEEEGRGEEREVGLEGAIRELAKEELSCIARELLFRRDRHQREREHGEVGQGEKLGVVRRRGLVAKGDGGHEGRESGSTSGKFARKSGLTAPKTGPLARKTSMSGSKTDSYKSESAPTGVNSGLKPSMRGSRTSLSSSKLVLLTSSRGHGSVAALTRGPDSRSSRGGAGEVGGGRLEIENLRNELKSLKKALIEQQARAHSEQEERERQHRAKLEAAEARHLQKETALQQKIATLTSTIESMEQERLPRKRGKVGGALTERDEMRKSLGEQETIILGYQKENKKLYSQLSETQSSLRAVREQLAIDTQRLRTELANTKAQLEAKSKDSANLAGGKAASKSDDIKQLQKQLEQTWDDLKQTRDDLKQTRDDLKGSQDRCRELERQVKQLKHSLHAQQQSTRNLGEGGGKGREEEEREEEMREKEKEILELREKLLAAQRREKTVRKKMAECEGSQKRVQELERQVRGLNDVIRRRFPNSLSALILAATSSTTDNRGKPLVGGKRGEGGGRGGGECDQLKIRVREMEDELRRREAETREKMAALERKHLAAESCYQEQIVSLERELERELKRGSRSVEEEELSLAGTVRDGVRGGEREEGGGGCQEEERNRELIRENETLRQQLSGMKIEAQHERLKLETRVAEAEAQTRALREESNSRVLSLKQGHMTEVDSLQAKLARVHSNSALASLRSQLSTLQVEHHLLRQRLEERDEEREALEGYREREKELSQQVQQLSEQLGEAKIHHTPEMHHFSSLLAKISALETRICSSEEAVRQRVERMRQPINHQMQQVEQKWRRVVQAKDAEIAQFRSEMDTILQTLHALQQSQHPSPSFVIL